MANDNFLVILKNLKERRAQSQADHTALITNLDTMIEKAENIIKSYGILARPDPSNETKDPQKKIKIEEILAVVRKAKKTIHIDEICKIIGDEKGSKVSRIQVSMLISHYIRKLKKKAEIQKLKKFSYAIKK